MEQIKKSQTADSPTIAITVKITVTVEAEVEGLEENASDGVKEDDENGMKDVICL